MDKSTLAGGCFWCTEAVFQKLNGVQSVTPGYSGGKTVNPTYDQIHNSDTGHAEAIQIEFDPQVISFATLLDVFFATHDPTTPDRQGHDIGSEYRSVIFYHSPQQKEVAQKKKAAIPNAVTQILPFTSFFPAESYHKDYYLSNPNQPYCKIVIDPKIQKLYKTFPSLLKTKV